MIAVLKINSKEDRLFLLDVLHLQGIAGWFVLYVTA